MVDQLPTSEYGDVCSSPDARLAMLRALRDYGLAVVHGERHIRQCHVDRDEVYSRLRALEQRLHGSSDGWSWARRT